MAPPVTRPSQSPKATPSPSVSDPETDIDAFLSFIGKLSSHGGYKRVKRLAQDHETLKSDLDDLRIAYNMNLKQLSKIGAEREAEKQEYVVKLKALEAQLSAAEREKAAAKDATDACERKAEDLRDQVQERERNIIRMTETVKKYEKDNNDLRTEKKNLDGKVSSLDAQAKSLNADLSSARSALAKKSEELRKAQTELAAVRSYIVKLPNLEVNRNQICQGLDSAFGSIFHLLGSELAANLPETCLEDIAAWDNIRDHKAIRRSIPLPRTNSPAAKRMRVIATVVILAHALVKHVLRPTYFLHQSEELDRVLEDLAKTHTDHDIFVRAVLLKATASGKQDPALARSDLAVREVATAVQHWIPADRRDGFCTEMCRLTNLLGETWKTVQRTRQRVNPSMSFELPEEWRRLPPITALQDTRSRSPSSAESSQPSGPLVDSEVIDVVWPAFLVYDESTWDLVHPGYALTREDIKEAGEEATRRGPRRSARRSEATNGTNRRDSGVSFLSPGQSDASPVK